MKRFALIALMIATGALIVFSPQGKASSGKKQTGVVEFSGRVKLRDVYLTGKYMFVHDDNKMARGEPCTTVYEYNENKKGAFIMEFHCTPVERSKAEKFFVRSVMLGPPHNLPEIREFQFAGSTEGHQVPR